MSHDEQNGPPSPYLQIVALRRERDEAEHARALLSRTVAMLEREVQRAVAEQNALRALLREVVEHLDAVDPSLGRRIAAALRRRRAVRHEVWRMAYWLLAVFWLIGACVLAAFVCAVFATQDERQSLQDELEHWEAERAAQRARDEARDDWPPRVH